MKTVTTTLALLMSTAAFAGGESHGGKVWECKQPDGSVAYEVMDFQRQRDWYKMKLDLRTDTRDHYEIVRSAFERLKNVDRFRAEDYLQKLSIFEEQTMPQKESTFFDTKDYAVPFYNDNCTPVVVFLQASSFRDSIAFNFDKRYAYFRNEKIWNRLDPIQKAGLVIHEIVYAEAIALGQKQSDEAMFVTALMTSTSMNEITEDSFLEMMTKAGYAERKAGGWYAMRVDRSLCEKQEGYMIHADRKKLGCYSILKHPELTLPKYPKIPVVVSPSAYFEIEWQKNGYPAYTYSVDRSSYRSAQSRGCSLDKAPDHMFFHHTGKLLAVIYCEYWDFWETVNVDPSYQVIAAEPRHYVTPENRLYIRTRTENSRVLFESCNWMTDECTAFGPVEGVSTRDMLKYIRIFGMEKEFYYKNLPFGILRMIATIPVLLATAIPAFPIGFIRDNNGKASVDHDFLPESLTSGFRRENQRRAIKAYLNKDEQVSKLYSFASIAHTVRYLDEALAAIDRGASRKELRKIAKKYIIRH